VGDVMQWVSVDDVASVASSPSESPVRASNSLLTRAVTRAGAPGLTRAVTRKNLNRKPSLQPESSSFDDRYSRLNTKPKRDKPRMPLLRHLSLGNLVLAASVWAGNQRLLALMCGMRLAQWSSNRRLKVRAEQLEKAVVYVKGEASWECVGPAPRPDDRCSSDFPPDRLLLSTDTTPRFGSVW